MAKATLYQMLEYLKIVLTPQMKTILRALKKDGVDENKLAETLKVRVNDIRKIMYVLSHNGYVTYEKQKSESKQWWYIYIWKLDLKKIKLDFLNKKKRELAKLQSRLNEALRHEFRCSKCGIELSMEQALEVGYMCPECGSALSEIKRRTSASKLDREVEILKKEIESA